MDIIGKQYLQTYWDQDHAEDLKPIIILNIDAHYDWFVARINDLIKRRKASPEAVKLFKLVNNAEEALQALDDYDAKGPEIVDEPIGNVSGYIKRKTKS
jgi:predicted Rossmann-fold nucleotide-binding protein